MPGIIDTNTAPSSDVPERAGVYLLTHPRSASNLFQTMMEKQPGYQNSGYKLFDAAFFSLMKLNDGPLTGRPEEERKEIYDAFRKGYQSLQDELADAKSKGLQAFVKEHAVLLQAADKMFAAVWPEEDKEVEPLILGDPNEPHTNPSSLPDHLLLSLQPIFQVRHPILMFPSMMRAKRDAFLPNTHPQDPICKVTLTLRYSRELYDWYLKNAASDRKPYVIDADDIMNDKEAVRQLCIATGLDPDAVQYEWEEKIIDDPHKKRFLSTISQSKGIIPGLASRGLDFETEKEKWSKEWNEEVAEGLAKHVADAMPDYKYMLSQRMNHNKDSSQTQE